ncbi:hypothetical protein BLA29_002839 [Euroglyphus maynei]|uniref:Uncharacterized protein n=1 Tax=Euroglyphus maynei TaxID=6958 RepID=A0A1Y3BC58_EURMA|nr:hypothetical protein BLA29_002839 [Euroglyphus maynei]
MVVSVDQFDMEAVCIVLKTCHHFDCLMNAIPVPDMEIDYTNPYFKLFDFIQIYQIDNCDIHMCLAMPSHLRTVHHFILENHMFSSLFLLN